MINQYTTHLKRRGHSSGRESNRQQIFYINYNIVRIFTKVYLVLSSKNFKLQACGPSCVGQAHCCMCTGIGKGGASFVELEPVERNRNWSVAGFPPTPDAPVYAFGSGNDWLATAC